MDGGFDAGPDPLAREQLPEGIPQQVDHRIVVVVAPVAGAAAEIPVVCHLPEGVQADGVVGDLAAGGGHEIMVIERDELHGVIGPPGQGGRAHDLLFGGGLLLESALEPERLLPEGGRQRGAVVDAQRQQPADLLDIGVVVVLIHAIGLHFARGAGGDGGGADGGLAVDRVAAGFLGGSGVVDPDGEPGVGRDRLLDRALPVGDFGTDP